MAVVQYIFIYVCTYIYIHIYTHIYSYQKHLVTSTIPIVAIIFLQCFSSLSLQCCKDLNVLKFCPGLFRIAEAANTTV